jgi:hypothetical protein
MHVKSGMELHHTHTTNDVWNIVLLNQQYKHSDGAKFYGYIRQI